MRRVRQCARLERSLLLVVRAPALSATPSAPPSAQERCGACGATVAEDQEWCLECGAARTQLRRPPDWRIPVTIVAVVILLVVLGLLIALVSLSIQANHI